MKEIKVKWDITLEHVLDLLTEFRKPSRAANLLGLDEDEFIRLEKEHELNDYIENELRENHDAFVYKVFDLKDTVVVPDEIVRKEKENCDYSAICEYLLDVYSYPVYSYVA